MNQFKVKIFNEFNEIITDDIWYGYSIDNVRFWVDLAIKDLLENGSYQRLSYYIESI